MAEGLGAASPQEAYLRVWEKLFVHLPPRMFCSVKKSAGFLLSRFIFFRNQHNKGSLFDVICLVHHFTSSACHPWTSRWPPGSQQKKRPKTDVGMHRFRWEFQGCLYMIPILPQASKFDSNWYPKSEFIYKYVSRWSHGCKTLWEYECLHDPITPPLLLHFCWGWPAILLQRGLKHTT